MGQTEKKEWKLVFKNKKAKKGWRDIEQRFPSAFKRCKEHLTQTPFIKITGSVFPMRGKKRKGQWEYELSEGDRVYYFPEKNTNKVIIFYAGTHPKKTPQF
ncbi:hypothetical protein N836_13540 [Leptolyngbya sp. Heron Island J]|uniref:hypothetical protein n=1 Tax=Leptolyngbya sp. Heron Island J TaxID=1385935 RepID=UPI0003B977F9|nr:hypothetical protein [Leptolyngbya sp. Heron Island J]ESA35083.1 hypothetical protein N836_13540 [Leptolyngbya sp. Heron Island J]